MSDIIKISNSNSKKKLSNINIYTIFLVWLFVFLFVTTSCTAKNAQEYFDEGKSAFASSDLSGAVSFFKKAIEKDHLFIDPYKALFFLWDKQKKYNNIIHFANDTIKNFADIDINHKAYLLFRKAKAHNSLNQYEKALSMAQQAVALNEDRQDYVDLVKNIKKIKKDQARKNYKKAKQLFSANEFDNALEIIQIAMKQDSTLSEARRLYADIQIERKDIMDKKEASKLKAEIMMLMRGENLEKALFKCDTAIDIQPENPEFTQLKKRVKNKIQERKDEKEAIRIENEKKIKRKNQLEYHNGLGIRAMKMENYKEAVKSFEIVLKIDPSKKIVQEQLNTAKKAIALELDIKNGKNAMAEGKLETAQHKFSSALKQVPGSKSICLLLIKCYSNMKKTDMAIKTIMNFLKIQPKSYDLYYEAAKIYVKADKYKKSLPMFRKYLDNIKIDHKAAIEYAQALDKLKKSPEALSFLKKQHDANRTNTDYIREMAKIQEKTNDFEAAIKSFKNFISMGKRDLETEAFYNMGCLYMKLEKYSDALERFRKVQKIDPSYKDTAIRIDKLRWKKYMPIVYALLAVCFLFFLKMFFAILGGFFEKIAESNQKNNLTRAKKLASQKKYDKAIALYEEILKKQSLSLTEKKSVLMGLSSTLSKTGNYDKAIFNAQQIIDVDRKNIKAYTILADAYSKSNCHEKAVGICRTAFDIDISVTALHKIFQASYLKTNNLEELLMEYDELAYENAKNLQLSNIILKLKKDNNITE